MRKCSIPGCDRKHKGKSFCQMHLDRLNRNGDPLLLHARIRALRAIRKELTL
jgi:hypothetical protein